ncbi:MAB_1171c family putative transporter [Streptomyces sp. NPDC002018]|uniref:MAB_1171c family putative transporter n=1 Tax=Streptomyces sp. NPDC002018 TaxID=3364629 RepID=UPI00369C0CAF
MTETLGEVLAYGPAGVSIGVGWYELRLARRGASSSAVRLLCWFGLTMGAAMVLLAPTTAAAAERAVPGAAPGFHLVGRVLEMAAMAFLPQAALRLAPRPPGRVAGRWHLGTTVTVLAVSPVLFLLGRPEVVAGTVTADASGWPWLAAFDSVFTLYTLFCLGLFTVPVGLYARGLPPGSLRTGLRLICAGAMVGLVWGCWGVVAIVSMVRTHRQGAGLDPVALTLGTTCLFLAALGVTAARWGPLLAAPAGWLRRYRDLRALEPLWSALHSVVPGTALGVSWRWAGRVDPRAAEFALYRRVVEIRDGYLALRPYLDPRIELWVEGALIRFPVPPAGLAATVEAATVAAALESARAGRTYGDAAAPGLTSPPAEDTVDAEAAWLIAVAEAFTLSAAVEYTRRRAREELARP